MIAPGPAGPQLQAKIDPDETGSFGHDQEQNQHRQDFCKALQKPAPGR
jgi:hypothetical protein